MIHFQELILATFLLGMLPGSAVFATISYALQGNRAHVIQFILGIIAGDFLFATLAMTGLSAFILALPSLLIFVQIAGGLYLIYLGARAWPHTRQSSSASSKENRGPRGRSFFIAGFVLTASNPKDLLFFVSFVPGFIDLSRAGLMDIILAALIISVIFLVTLSFYAVTATWAGDKLASPKIRRYLDYTASIVLILLGLFTIGITR